MSGSVMPGLAPLPATWNSFFIAVAEVSATLAGLSFVAVSAHPSILRASRTRYRAQRTLMTFVVVLVGSLILAMPQPPADITTTVLFWSSVAGVALTITSIVREGHFRTPREWLRIAGSLNSVEFLVAYTVAGIWALLHLSPADQPLNPHVLGSAMIVAVGWSALQTWRLMQLALHARWQDDYPATAEPSDRPPGMRPTARAETPTAPARAPRRAPRAEQDRDGP